MKPSVVVAGCAVVAMFSLTAARCTPEQIAAVEANQRASEQATVDSVDMPAVTDPPEVKVTGGAMPDGATWSVIADCDGAQINLTGWTGVTDVWDDGSKYANLGLGGAPPFAIHLDDAGNADRYIAADIGTAGTSRWGWSLLINGPGLNVRGEADC